jgi:hypothetical protein
MDRVRSTTPYERFLAELECFDGLSRGELAQLARVLDDVSLPAGTSLEVAAGERCVLASGVLAGANGVVAAGQEMPPGAHHSLGVVRVLLLPRRGVRRAARTRVIPSRSEGARHAIALDPSRCHGKIGVHRPLPHSR